MAPMWNCMDPKFKIFNENFRFPFVQWQNLTNQNWIWVLSTGRIMIRTVTKRNSARNSMILSSEGKHIIKTLHP
jgi:hypothetical protein